MADINIVLIEPEIPQNTAPPVQVRQVVHHMAMYPISGNSAVSAMGIHRRQATSTMPLINANMASPTPFRMPRLI